MLLFHINSLLALTLDLLPHIDFYKAARLIRSQQGRACGVPADDILRQIEYTLHNNHLVLKNNQICVE